MQRTLRAGCLNALAVGMATILLGASAPRSAGHVRLPNVENVKSQALDAPTGATFAKFSASGRAARCDTHNSATGRFKKASSLMYFPRVAAESGPK